MPDPVIPAQVPATVVEAVPPVAIPVLVTPVTPQETVSSVAATTPQVGLQAPVVTEVQVVAPAQEVPPAAVVDASSEAGKAPVAPETVLGAELAKEEVKPVVEPVKDAPEVKAEEAVKTEEGQSAEPAPPPKYDPFTLPGGVSLDETRVGEFNGLLSELELSGKADHAAVQAFGQKAVEFHIQEVKKTAEELTKLYQTTWEKQKLAWKDQFMKDPELGGNRYETTVKSALGFIRTHGGTPEQQAEFRNLMETSGLGNNLAMIRLLAQAGSRMSEGTPLAASKPADQQKSKTETMYGKRR